MALGKLHDHVNRAKHSLVGQAKPGFPHFADDGYNDRSNIVTTILVQQSQVALTATSIMFTSYD